MTMTTATANAATSRLVTLVEHAVPPRGCDGHVVVLLTALHAVVGAAVRMLSASRDRRATSTVAPRRPAARVPRQRPTPATATRPPPP